MPIRLSNLRAGIDDPETALLAQAARALDVRIGEIQRWRILRKSLDARDKGALHFVYTAEVSVGDDEARVAELADGRTHIAADAARLGLIDGVATLDSVFTQFSSGRGVLSPAIQTKGPKMDAIQEWETAVRAKLDSSPRMTRSDAIRAVVREQPELQAAYLAAWNERYNQTRG